MKIKDIKNYLDDNNDTFWPSTEYEVNKLKLTVKYLLDYLIKKENEEEINNMIDRQRNEKKK